jgi:hypothetical protein
MKIGWLIEAGLYHFLFYANVNVNIKNYKLWVTIKTIVDNVVSPVLIQTKLQDEYNNLNQFIESIYLIKMSMSGA